VRLERKKEVLGIYHDALHPKAQPEEKNEAMPPKKTKKKSNDLDL